MKPIWTNTKAQQARLIRGQNDTDALGTYRSYTYEHPKGYVLIDAGSYPSPKDRKVQRWTSFETIISGRRYRLRMQGRNEWTERGVMNAASRFLKKCLAQSV